MSAGHTHTYNYELTGFDLTAGILTGLTLCAVLQSAVLYQNFKPWFKEPNLKPLPSPRHFLGASMHSFFAMVVTCAVLTFTFSRLDFDHNPIIDYWGYNNVCILFDTAPSTYVAPIFWFFVAYLIVRFAVEDTKRLMQMKHISVNLRRVSYGANVFLVAVAATFSLCLAIGPEENMVMHTSPFVALMIAMPLVFVMHCFQDQNRKMIFVVACTAFMIVSIIKVIFASIALIQFENFGPVPPSISQPMDLIWVLMALTAPFLMPVPSIDPSEK
tara:strand:- start:171 stop:986 length:816 start_codon:yes stop_codon:yes gene_type:complete